jgi:hypothetical protein
LGLNDGGAQSYLRIEFNGTAGSLETALQGFIVKNSPTTVINRNFLVSGAGLGITDGDGILGNPMLSLTGLAQAFANVSGTGLVAVIGGTTVTPRSILDVANQTVVTNGNAGAGNPTVGLADNPIVPGTASLTLPNGTSAQRGVAYNGSTRYNTDLNIVEIYINGTWTDVIGISGFSGISGYSGFSGYSGISGYSGTSGFSSNYYTYNANTLITSGDPTAGKILWNNVTQISATQINISNLENTNVDISAFLALIDTTEEFLIQDQSNYANTQKWVVTGTPTQVGGLYWTVPATLASSTGTGTTGFANNLPLILAVVNGISGYSGISG